MARAAQRSGVEELRRVEQGLGRGWPPGLTVLTGDDLYHLDRAQRLLLEGLAGDDAAGFGLTVFGEEKVDVAVVVTAARSVGMFAPRRVVFVRDIAALEGEPDALVEFAQAPPPRSHLVVRAPALDQRRKLHQALGRGAHEVLIFSAGKSAGGAADARRIGREKGLDVDPAAAAFLGEIVGGDLYRLDRELEKIRAWLGGTATRVDSRVVREVASGGGLLSGWELADAVVRRDRAAGLAAARRLALAGEEAVRTVGGVAWRARVLLQAKALALAGRRVDEIVRATRAFYFREALIQGLERYTMAELLAFPSALLEADRTLKSRSIAAAAVLERLVDRLTGERPTGERR